MAFYVIKKDGKFVKDFSDGKKTTTQFNQIEFYTNRKSAIEAAREYGRMNGKGYTVAEWGKL